MDEIVNPLEFEAFHGCAEEAGASIVCGGFRSSQGDHHWLGEGVYFFRDGISCSAQDDAKEWAIAQSWDDAKKSHKYRKWSIVQVFIKSTRYLDATTDEGKKKINYARNQIMKKINRVGHGWRCNDAIILKNLSEIMNFQLVIADFYIKFTQQRVKNISSRLPNTRVVCVKTPDEVIDKASIKIIHHGVITPQNYGF